MPEQMSRSDSEITVSSSIPPYMHEDTDAKIPKWVIDAENEIRRMVDDVDHGKIKGDRSAENKYRKRRLSMLMMALGRTEGRTARQVLKGTGTVSYAEWSRMMNDPLMADIFSNVYALAQMYANEQIWRDIGEAYKLLAQSSRVAVGRIAQLMFSKDDRIALQAANDVLRYAGFGATSRSPEEIFNAPEQRVVDDDDDGFDLTQLTSNELQMLVDIQSKVIDHHETSDVGERQTDDNEKQPPNKTHTVISGHN